MRELFNCSLFYLLSQSKIDCIKYILRMSGVWKMLRQVPEVSQVTGICLTHRATTATPLSSMHARENGNIYNVAVAPTKERKNGLMVLTSVHNCHTVPQLA